MTEKDPANTGKSDTFEWNVNKLSPEELKRIEERKKYLEENLGDLFSYITETYEPATAATALVTKTTFEIYEELQKIFPAEYTPGDVYNILKKFRFTFGTPDKDLSFVWLMRPKSRL